MGISRLKFGQSLVAHRSCGRRKVDLSDGQRTGQLGERETSWNEATVRLESPEFTTNASQTNPGDPEAAPLDVVRQLELLHRTLLSKVGHDRMCPFSPEPGMLSKEAAKPLVSIIIACFNQGQFLPESISSVHSQEYDPLEVIVVNDGSTDETSAVAKASGVRLIEQSNRGLAAARNAGLMAASGKFVVFLDADDRLLPGALASGIALLQDGPSLAFVYGHVQLIDGFGQLLKTPKQKTITNDHYAALLAENFIWTPGVVIYRADAVRKVGGFDTRYPPTADLGLNLRLLREYPAGCNDRTVLQYRLHEGSMSKHPDVMLKAYLSVLRGEAEHVRDDPSRLAALRKHMLGAQRDFGGKLASRVRARLLSGQFHLAVVDLLILSQLYPGGLLNIIIPSPLRSRFLNVSRFFSKTISGLHPR